MANKDALMVNKVALMVRMVCWLTTRMLSWLPRILWVVNKGTLKRIFYIIRKKFIVESFVR